MGNVGAFTPLVALIFLLIIYIFQKTFGVKVPKKYSEDQKKEILDSLAISMLLLRDEKIFNLNNLLKKDLIKQRGGSVDPEILHSKHIERYLMMSKLLKEIMMFQKYESYQYMNPIHPTTGKSDKDRHNAKDDGDGDASARRKLKYAVSHFELPELELAQIYSKNKESSGQFTGANRRLSRKMSMRFLNGQNQVDTVDFVVRLNLRPSEETGEYDQILDSTETLRMVEFLQGFEKLLDKEINRCMNLYLEHQQHLFNRNPSFFEKPLINEHDQSAGEGQEVAKIIVTDSIYQPPSFDKLEFLLNKKTIHFILLARHRATKNKLLEADYYETLLKYVYSLLKRVLTLLTVHGSIEMKCDLSLTYQHFKHILGYHIGEEEWMMADFKEYSEALQ